MLGVARILENRGIKTAILVSDPFHMLRLSIIGSRVRAHAVYVADAHEPDIAQSREALEIYAERVHKSTTGISIREETVRLHSERPEEHRAATQDGKRALVSVRDFFGQPISP